MAFARTVSDRVVFMDQGVVLEDAAPAGALLAIPGYPRVPPRVISTQNKANVKGPPLATLFWREGMAEVWRFFAHEDDFADIDEVGA